MKRFVGLAMIVAFAAGVLVSCQPPPPPPTDRPNILIVMSDDQANSIYNRALMPNVFSQIVDQGIAFDRAYINTPLCCPSRAQTLTGLYEHHSAVTDNNSAPLDRPTIVEALKSSGYRTMLAGKYLNSANCDPRPEFDKSSCYSTTGTGYSLVNPIINVDGTLTQYSGYTTDILAGMVSDFVASTPADKPFFAMYTPTSPHLPADDPRYSSMPVTPWRPPSYDEDVTADHKPTYLEQHPMTTAEKAKIDGEHQVMTQVIPPLDNSVDTILDSLGSRADNTMVVYFSDNGWLYGEHRWKYKVAPYEESTRVPFAIRFPTLTADRAGTVSDTLVENIDLAATMADIADIDWVSDGRSLVPLLDGSASSVRSQALIEACDGTKPNCWTDGQAKKTGPSLAAVPFYRGLVTDQYKYVEYVTGEKELYDLLADPYELDNLDGAAEVQGVEGQLHDALIAELQMPPPDTAIVTGPAATGTDTLARFRYTSQSPKATYQCRLDPLPDQGAWAPCNGQSFQTVLAPGSYELSVAAIDELGRTDPTPATRDFTITGGGPDVTLSSMPPILGNAKSATFAFSSSDPDATFKCRTWLTAATRPTFGTCTSPKTYSGRADGVQRFEVEALVGGVRSSAPAAWEWTVDTVGPTFRFERPPPPQTKSTTAQFVVNPMDLLAATPTCKLDQRPATACSTKDFISYSGLSYASHTLAITGTDVAGNTKTTTYTWTVSKNAPSSQSILPGAD